MQLQQHNVVAVVVVVVVVNMQIIYSAVIMAYLFQWFNQLILLLTSDQTNQVGLWVFLYAATVCIHHHHLVLQGQ